MLLLHLLQVRSGIQVGLEGGSEEEEVFAIITASRSCAAEHPVVWFLVALGVAVVT